MPSIIRQTNSVITLINSILGFCLAFLLSGCSSTSPNIIPSTGPDTLEVYQHHVAGLKSAPAAPEADTEANTGTPGSVGLKQGRAVADDDQDLAGYTREAHNEISLVFPRLPNPELVIYVFAHMSAKGRPIPGYSTSFPMYEKDEYALPGEVAP